jgi:hypothetical protein
MASDTALLDGLNWSEPEATETCTYEAAGWSCRSTGFLWFSEARDGGERLYPCPRCNTELFLAKSKQRFSAERAAARCVCCGPGLAPLAYESALDEARLQTENRLDVTGAAE